MTQRRIVSFLPAATEMVYALGLGDQLVGVSHECDFPPLARSMPVVVRPALPVETMSFQEIDRAVSARIASGASLYEIDEPLLRELAPTLILTQNLCQVCAPSGSEIAQVLRTLAAPPEILWLTPKSLEGVRDNLRELGRVTGRLPEAEALIASGLARLEKVAALTDRAATRPRVFCLEWVDPLYCSGHWMAEMVEIAGGVDGLSRRGTDSVRIAWADVVHWAPEILVIMPCGFHLKQAVGQAAQLAALPGWAELPAVRAGRVYAADANSYFARPGPRLVDGVELLAHLFHPDLAAWRGPREAFQRIGSSPLHGGAAGGGDMRPATEKFCGRCGSAFRCGPTEGKCQCWCDDLPHVSPPAGKGHDCLCPDCLRAAIECRDLPVEDPAKSCRGSPPARVGTTDAVP